MKRILNIGIAGAGLMGQTHAHNYLKLNNAKIYALAEKNPDKQIKFKEQFEPLKIYEDVFEMVNDRDLDIIDICLPTPLHAECAIAALNNNKNVLLEKPIAMNMEEAELIKTSSVKSKGKIMIGHVLRFWPDYTSLKKVMHLKKLHQKSVVISALRFNEYPLWSEDRWIMNEELSGGVIVDLIIHDIDFIIWSFGKVEKVFCHGIYDNNNFTVQVMAVLKMKNGMVAYVEGGYLNPGGTGLTSNMKIYGQQFFMEMYSDKKYIRLHQENKPPEDFPIEETDGYYEQVKYFLKCVEQDTEPDIVTIDEAIESLKTCLAIRKSFKEEKWIMVN